MLPLILIIWCITSVVSGYFILFDESDSEGVADTIDSLNDTPTLSIQKTDTTSKKSDARQKKQRSRYFYRAAIIYNSSYVVPGAVIESRYVITSASSMLNWKNYSVVVTVNEPNDSKYLYGIEDVIFNPSYSLGTNNNVAIIKLNNTIKFSNRVNKISILTKLRTDKTLAFVLCWAADNNNIYKIHKITAEILRETNCKSMYITSIISQSCICAYEKEGNQLETVDSGAPLVYKGKLVGIFQGIMPTEVICKTWPNCPGIFTQLLHLNEWVNEIIQS